MDHEQLLKLVGEHTLLRREREQLHAQQERDRAALLNLHNTADYPGPTAEWLAGGVALLQRIHETHTKLGVMDQRLSMLSRLTSLS